MAIEDLGIFIEEQLKREGLTEAERDFLLKQQKAVEKELNPNSVEQRRRKAILNAINLGKRLNAVWGNGPHETPIREFTNVLRSSANELLEAVKADTPSPVVNFVMSMTQGEKILVSSSLYPLQRLMGKNGTIEPTIGDYRRTIVELNQKSEAGEPVIVTTVPFAGARLAFVTTAFQKAPSTG